jgi:ABC-type dipeptide/oligopeptide/nickel transport system permease subunit
MTTIWIGTAIRLEASLSFIGLGAQPPAPSWGNIVRDGVSNLFSSPLPALFAGLAITLAVLAFNILGDALRDYLDPDRMTR